MTPIYSALAVILAAIISGVVAWLIARRTTSGKIDTSEAAKLWDEGTVMRKELRDEVILLKQQLNDAIAAVTGLNREIKASRSETEHAREETRQSRSETRILMEQIELLHAEVQTNNTLTIAALADNAETRRILEVPKSERTPVEFDHLATVDDRQPTDEHPPVPDKELRNGDTKNKKELRDE